MAIIDPVYLINERNHFPKLTDAEFEALCLYCQTANFKEVAEYRNCSERRIRILIDACRGKLGVNDDLSIFLTYLSRSLDKRTFFPGLSDGQSLLLSFYSLLGNQSMLPAVTGCTRNEVKEELIRIRKILKVRSVSALRFNFLVKFITSRQLISFRCEN